jgi:hypothetical protein
MKMATAPWITQSLCAETRAGSADATQSANAVANEDALGRRERDGDARRRRRTSPGTDDPDHDARDDIDARAVPPAGARASREVARASDEGRASRNRS